jgi:hypothetical protein
MSDKATKPALHFIAPRDAHGQRVALTKPDSRGYRDSGNWNVIGQTASQAVALGAEIHLHETRDEPSWLAGRIVGWHSVMDEKGNPKAVFTFAPDDGLRRKQTEGWGQEKAYVGVGRGR